MAVNISLTNIDSLQNETTAIAAFTANNEAITTAFQDVLALDGTSPNQMQTDLDMNSFQIINLPSPAATTSPLRLQDLNTFIGGGTIYTVPSGGSTGDSLVKKSNANYDMEWSTNTADISASTGITLTGSNPTAISITNTAVTTGTYGAASTIPSFTVNAQGQLTAASNTTTLITSSHGGTGIANNAANTITFSGNYGLTLTLTGTTSITLPTTGIVAALSGTNTWTNIQTFTSDIMLGASNTPTALLTVTAQTGTLPTPFTGTALHIIGTNSAAFTSVDIDTFAGAAIVTARRADGTLASPSAVAANGTVFSFGVQAYDGTAYNSIGALNFQTTSLQAHGTDNSGHITFQTVSAGSTSLTTRMSLYAGFIIGTGTTDPGAGNLTVGGTTASTSTSTGALTVGGGVGIAGAAYIGGTLGVPGTTTPIFTSIAAITTGAGSSAGTITNAPSAGNPTKWIPINDNGTTRYIPAW